MLLCVIRLDALQLECHVIQNGPALLVQEQEDTFGSDRSVLDRACFVLERFGTIREPLIQRPIPECIGYGRNTEAEKPLFNGVLQV